MLKIAIKFVADLKKILVIQTASLGDVILSTSVLESIYALDNNVALHILVKKGNEALFANHPFITKIHVWDKKNNKRQSLKQIRKEFRKIGFDYIFNIQRFFSTGFLSIRSGAKSVVGFKKNPCSLFFSKAVRHDIGNKVHEIERNHQLVQAVFPDADLKKPRLYPSEKDFDSVKKYKTSAAYYCIAPASLWFTKQYPVEKWVEIIDMLDTNTNIYLSGSAADKAICQEIIKKSTHPNIDDLSASLSLLELAALMHDAAMNFVNDSAPLHIASAMNAKLCCIFCSTIPDFGFGPLSDISHIIEAKPYPPCKPCGLHGKKHCPIKTFDCAYNINKQDIIDCLK